MKGLTSAVRLSIVTLFVSMSWVSTQELCFSKPTSALDHTHVTQASSPLADSNYLESTLERNFVTVGIGQSDFSLEQPILNDPYYDKQWALHRIGLQELRQATKEGSNAIIAILDTGIDKNHEDLYGKVIAETNFTNSPTASDAYGHGTHIAGIIAASANNGKGIIGLAPESGLINVKVADDEGVSKAELVAKGIIWATDKGANIVNISLQFKEPSPDLEAAVNYAWSRGIVVVAAAGNNSNNLPIYPAFYENCIAVAAIKQDHTLAPLSNYGDWVDVVAPGFNICSTIPGDTYGCKTGTSFAAAYVSGLAALLFSVTNDSNGDGRINDEVRAAIEAYCLRVCTG